VPNRAKDWFKQAERDLEQAKAAFEDGRFEWACFISHQSAEKAIKALHLHLGQEAWGHVLARLLAELPEGKPVPNELREQSRVLDNFYIPTRYPDSHPEGAPFEHFGSLQGEEAIRYAGAILEFVRDGMAVGREGL
jgi:HEPN domain-containing protein